MLNDLLIFFFITIFFQASLLGHSIIFFNKVKFSDDVLINNHIKYIYSIIIISLLGFLLYIFSIKNFIPVEIFWLSGFLFFLFNFKKIFKNSKIEFIFIFILFSGLIISKTHDDFIAYHLRYIYHITQNNLILGSGNIEVNYIYTPFFSYFQKMFVNNYFSYNILHIPVFIIYSNFISFLFRIYKEKKFYSKYILIFFIFFLIKYSRLADFGYDSLCTFILISLLLIFLIQRREGGYTETIVYLTIFIYCVSIKVTSIFFLPLILLIFFKNKNNFCFSSNFYLNSIIFFLLSFFLILDNFIKSGCFLYFLNFTCLNQKTALWAVSNEVINNFSQHAELWAKGFYHQKIITNKIKYLENFNWVNNWINIHFFYKVTEYLIAIVFIIFLIFSSTTNFAKSSFVKFTNFISYDVLACLIAIFLWFFTLPQLRFGEPILIASFLIILDRLYEKIYSNKNAKNIFVILIIISIVIFNFKNFKRIYSELNRNDEVYKFSNFPYPAKITGDIIDWKIINNKFIETQLKQLNNFKNIKYFK